MGCSARVGGRGVFANVGMAVAVGRVLTCSGLFEAVVGVEVVCRGIPRRVTSGGGRTPDSRFMQADRSEAASRQKRNLRKRRCFVFMVI